MRRMVPSLMYSLVLGLVYPVSVYWLGEIASLICNSYLSVAAGKSMWAYPPLRYISHFTGMRNNLNNRLFHFSITVRCMAVSGKCKTETVTSRSCRRRLRNCRRRTVSFRISTRSMNVSPSGLLRIVYHGFLFHLVWTVIILGRKSEYCTKKKIDRMCEK